MDRFASMHDEDIDKLGIPRPGTGGEGGWKGRKRARELSQLKGRLDRASEKEQQSWDLLQQAVKGGGSAVDDGRFKATGTNKAAEEMRERTVGLVTAEEFRKAREAADSLEEAEAKQRQEEQAAEERARESSKRKAEKKKKKAAEKKKRLQKSTMSFALEEDDEGTAREDKAAESNGEGSGASAEVKAPPAEGNISQEDTVAEDSTAATASGAKARDVGTDPGSSVDVAERSLKGAAPDQENSSAAALLRTRLGR